MKPLIVPQVTARPLGVPLDLEAHVRSCASVAPPGQLVEFPQDLVVSTLARIRERGMSHDFIVNAVHYLVDTFETEATKHGNHYDLVWHKEATS